jgi:hypothetical protein
VCVAAVNPCLALCRLRDALRAGKRFLKEANGSAAMVRFEKALMLSKAICDKVRGDKGWVGWSGGRDKPRAAEGCHAAA